MGTVGHSSLIDPHPSATSYPAPSGAVPSLWFFHVPQLPLEVLPSLAEATVFASQRNQLVVHARAMRNSLVVLSKNFRILRVEDALLLLNPFISLLHLL